MEWTFWKIILIIVLVGLVLNSYYPSMYDQTYGQVTQSVKGYWNGIGLNTQTDNGNKEDIILPNGEIISNYDSGTILGQCFDYWPCINHAQCRERYSVYAKCNNLTGDCYIS